MSDPVMAYVGFSPCCRAPAFASVIIDDPAHRRYSAREVAKLIRCGWTIKTTPAEWVRANFRPCRCQEKATAPKRSA